MIQFPDKRYNILYADPPWEYRDKAKAGNRGVEFHYPVMKLQDIMSLPVQQISADKSMCFMWVTMPHLPSGLATLAAWGFTFKTVPFVWVKTNQSFNAELARLAQVIERLEQSPESVWRVFEKFAFFKGMGHYTRANAELVLLGTKGKGFERFDKGVPQIVFAPRGKHSAKPEEVRRRIERLYVRRDGDMTRLEMFARTRVPNWDAWGNEVPDECAT